MTTHRHRLLEADVASSTGTCQACGPVELGWRTVKGARVYRCGIAVRSQRKRNANGKVHARPENVRAHGLTSSQARAMRNEVGACEICGQSTDLVVDHCHTQLVIRGVLCRNCNAALGFMHDDPDRLRRAARYLEKHEAPSPKVIPG